MRWFIVPVGVVLAIVLWAFGLVFDLNGGNWDWWRDGSQAAALFVLGLTAWTATRMRGRPWRLQWTSMAGILGGSAVVALSAAIMGRRYNDSYYGSPLWPHLLATAAAAGLAVALLSAAAALPGPPRRRGPRARP